MFVYFLVEIKHLFPRPEVTRFKRPNTPRAVKQDEKIEHDRTMQALDFETSTLVKFCYVSPTVAAAGSTERKPTLHSFA